MLTTLLFALLTSTVLAVPATPVKDRALSKRLKQATRKDIVARATRPRPKRATVSGSVIPDSSNMQTFAMRAGGTGNENVDGTYAQAYTTQPSEQYTYAAFGPGGESTAALYYLDADSYLVRASDNQYAYGGDYTESGGLTYIPFNLSKDRIGTGNGNEFIQCSVSFDSTLSCALANVEPAAKSTQLVLCGVFPAELGLADPERIEETGCSAAVISALQASP